ncbi:hypothetical protein D3C81_1247990 [compost metagenome]
MPADHAEVVDLGVGQIDLLGEQVVACLGQARLGLVEVGHAAYATLAAQPDLIVDALMAAQVVFGKAHQCLAP